MEDQTVALYDAVDRKKLRDMVTICRRARIGCVCATGALVFIGALLPLLVNSISAWTVWGCMIIEALAFVIYLMGEYVKTILNKSWRF